MVGDSMQIFGLKDLLFLFNSKIFLLKVYYFQARSVHGQAEKVLSDQLGILNQRIDRLVFILYFSQEYKRLYCLI